MSYRPTDPVCNPFKETPAKLPIVKGFHTDGFQRSEWETQRNTSNRGSPNILA